MDAQRLQSFLRIVLYLAVLVQEEIRIRLPVKSPHPPAYLVQLRQAKLIRPFNN